jgi:hypothetical protein
MRKFFFKNRLFVFLGMAGIFLTGCTKNENLTISGLLTDPNQAIPVGGTTVELWTQRIESGVFLANYSLMGTVISGTDGRFQFEMENKNYTGIRLIFARAGYFGWTLDLNADQVREEGGIDAVYQMLPKAVIEIHVVNDYPVDDNDYFEFRLLNGFTDCEACCTGEKYKFFGTQIDQVVLCQVIGHQDIMIQWQKQKNGEQISSTDVYFVKAFDTTGIVLSY